MPRNLSCRTKGASLFPPPHCAPTSSPSLCAAAVSEDPATQGKTESGHCYVFDVNVGENYLFEEFHSVFVFEGWETSNHFVDETAQTPPVDFNSMAEFLDDFGGEVLWGSANGLGFFVVGFEDLGEAKIG